MIKFPSLFGRIPKHQRFNYEPRYFDAKKEEKEAREARLRLEAGGNTDDYSTGSYRLRISGAFKSSRKNSKNISPELNALVVRLGIMLLLTVMLIAWLQWGQVAFYMLLLIVPAYFWVRFNRKR